MFAGANAVRKYFVMLDGTTLRTTDEPQRALELIGLAIKPVDPLHTYQDQK
jgi:hypothetical protein